MEYSTNELIVKALAWLVHAELDRRIHENTEFTYNGQMLEIDLAEHLVELTAERTGESP